MDSQQTRSTHHVLGRLVVTAFQSGAIGLTGGLAVSAFIGVLNWATTVAQHAPIVHWVLPIVGVATAAAYTLGPVALRVDVGSCWRGLKRPNDRFSVASAPVLALATLGTHACGGSAGREGTAVQMAAVISDWLSIRVPLAFQLDRQVTLRFGLAAGFAAAIGTPWVGVMFAIELLKKRLSVLTMVGVVIAAHSASWIRQFWIGSGADFPLFSVPGLSVHAAIVVGLIALVAACSARVLLGGIAALQRVSIRQWWLLPATGGVLMAAMATVFPVVSGLGLHTIHHAFTGHASGVDSFLKGIATWITVGSGFKGGEFVPLVWMGATAGSALGKWWGLSVGLAAAIGYVAAFVGGSCLPLTGIILAIELFGWAIAPYAVLGCGLAALVADPHHTIYTGVGKDGSEG